MYVTNKKNKTERGEDNMSSTNKTSLGLNMWVASDKPVRQDFVNDNVIVDKEVTKLKQDIVNGDAAIDERINKLNSNLSKLKSAYTVRKQIQTNKTYNANAWITIPDLSFTVPERSIVLASGSLFASRNTPGTIDFYFDDCFFQISNAQANQPHQCSPQLVKVVGSGKQFNINVYSSTEWMTTIQGSVDNRSNYIDYLIIPLD